jgi:hypothetical protein
MTGQDAFNLANQQYRAGQSAQAIAICRQIISLDANQPEVWHLLGLALFNSGDAAGAVEPIARAISLQAGRMDFYYNLALVFDSLKRRTECHAALLGAAGSKIMDLNLLTQVGRALYFMGHPAEALHCAEQLVQLRPDDPRSHWNYAILLLLHGRLAEGYREFEWRLQVPEFAPKTRPTCPAWDGSPILNQSLLICSEGGHGDVLLYLRFLPMLKGMAGRIILECASSLIPLAESLDGIDQITPMGEPLPPADRHIFLCSLPHVMGIDLANIPSRVPYVSPPVQTVAKWSGRVPPDGMLNVGLVWSGNRAAAPGDKRSVPLEALAPMAQIPRIRFVSLQLGRDAAQTPPPGLELIDFTSDIHDFADTAALANQLDLIISIDTSVAHLAGALGRPVWVLVQKVAAYQWLLDRSDSPWYPTMRLFRQPDLEDWTTPIAEMSQALEEKVKSRPSLT